MLFQLFFQSFFPQIFFNFSIEKSMVDAFDLITRFKAPIHWRMVHMTFNELDVNVPPSTLVLLSKFYHAWFHYIFFKPRHREQAHVFTLIERIEGVVHVTVWNVFGKRAIWIGILWFHHIVSEPVIWFCFLPQNPFILDLLQVDFCILVKEKAIYLHIVLSSQLIWVRHVYSSGRALFRFISFWVVVLVRCCWWLWMPYVFSMHLKQFKWAYINKTSLVLYSFCIRSGY